MYGLVDLEMVKEISNLMKRDDELQQAAERKPGIVAQLIENLRQKPGSRYSRNSSRQFAPRAKTANQ